MALWIPSVRRLFRLATGRNEAAELDVELDHHIALARQELVDQGIDPSEAERRARAAFGDRSKIRRDLASIGRIRHRASRRADRLDRWRTDARLAWRGLTKDPWFLINGAGMVAVALGANIAVFSIFNAAFFRRLPYPEADRIVSVQETHAGGLNRVAGLNVRDWQQQSRDFAHLAAYSSWQAPLLVNDRPEIVNAGVVSRSFTGVMGVAPIAGRWFSPEEATAGGPRAIVVSERFWLSRFGGDRNALGSILRLDGVPVTLVGIMPDRLDFPVGVEVWTPAEPFDPTPNRTAHNWYVVARLADGVTVAGAEERLTLLTKQLVSSETGDRQYLADGAALQPFRETLLGQSDRLILLLQGAVALLMLIGALNLAALLLARAAKRQAESSMVLALGAGRGDLIRRLALEGLLVTALGAGLGGLAWWVARPRLSEAVASALPFVRELPVDGSFLVGVVVAVLATGVGAGSGAGWWVARSAARAGRLVDSQRTTRPGKLLQGLVAGEVAATFVLLVGALLLGRTLDWLLAQPLGFAVDQRFAVAVNLPTADGSPYLEPARHRAFFDELVARIAGVPGVKSAAVSTSVPLRDYSPNGGAEIQGEATGRDNRAPSDFRVVGPGFFATMGIPILRGRDFEASDGETAPYVAVVSSAFGRLHLRGADPLGRLIRFQGMDAREDGWASVVGVVGDTRHDGPSSKPQPTVYYSYRQRPQLYRQMTVVAELRDPNGAFGPAAAKVVAAMEPTVPFLGGPLSVRDVVAEPRVRAVALGAFGGAALLLSAVGLFGVVGFLVLTRTREFGVRIALGAPARRVAAAAARYAAQPVLLGLVLGLGLALIATRTIRGYLYELSPNDPATFLLAGGLVLGAALVAAVPGVRRALSVAPTEALRSDG